MRVLWVSMVPFPPLCEYLGKNVPAYCGWLYSSAKSLLKIDDSVTLGVIVSSMDDRFQTYEIDGICYYMVPSKSLTKTSPIQIKSCREAIKQFAPDLIHIHGTEYALAKATCIANDRDIKIIANIQGLAGPYTRYADGGLSFKDKFLNITPLDFWSNTLLLKTQTVLGKRAECEEFVLNHITDIVGRTRWDHDHVLTMNPDLHYHIMNETLRNSFYEEPLWSYDNCKKHTIFVSNSGVALKGAHQVLKALPIILKQYPDTKVKFCGSSVMNNDIQSLIHFHGYHLYLRRLVHKLGLEKHVEFLGGLSEAQMKQQFLDANVYVMPSAIENSPNSLCEAQILGTPAVASYCGGVPDLIEDRITGWMYRYEEVEMLAQIVMSLFSRTDFDDYSTKTRKMALQRHDKRANSVRLLEIYRTILS